MHQAPLRLLLLLNDVLCDLSGRSCRPSCIVLGGGGRGILFDELHGSGGRLLLSALLLLVLHCLALGLIGLGENDRGLWLLPRLLARCCASGGLLEDRLAEAIIRIAGGLLGLRIIADHAHRFDFNLGRLWLHHNHG